MKATCTVDTCERDRDGRGLCAMHYQRARKRGQLPPLPVMDLAKRITAHLIRTPNGCLEWTGSRLPRGYGHLKAAGKDRYAHRLTWELAHGPIPDGMYVCHTCDNPPCCEITHLWLGTPTDNAADRDAKGRNGMRKR
jgi:hypothetical protein